MVNFYKLIDKVDTELTSHGSGLKKVLVSNSDTTSAITQIAITELMENIDEHLHRTMDEHFIFLAGECFVHVDNVKYHCIENSYLYIPAMRIHSIQILKRVKLLTIGVALD